MKEVTMYINISKFIKKEKALRIIGHRYKHHQQNISKLHFTS